MAFEDFFETTFDYDEERQKFLDHLDFLKSMTVEEQTLYKKWNEVNTKYAKEANASRATKAEIWKPTDIFDKDKTIQEVESLQPKVILIDDKLMLEKWTHLRIFCHTMLYDVNPGRNLKFLIQDEVSEKYLGVLTLGSDIIKVSARDNWIGWTDDNRMKDKKLNNTAIGTCIMSTQPFGYNFLGGKLAASLLTTDVVRNEWERRYESKLVGFTTTSLYGPSSMYNAIPYWKGLGVSSGKIIIKPDDKFYSKWHNWIKENRTDDYKRITKSDNNLGVASGVKQRIMQLIFSELGIKVKDYVHGFERGIYFAELYENTKQYLRNEIQEDELKMKEKFAKGVDGIMEWWKPKAIKRYSKLHEESRLESEVLYYNDLIGITWEEAKEKYIARVGR